ncbi:hypothetical protein NHX12_030664 [Muraenolepis orangiensis]|uniref:Uncharacterized protein n=1 Tax=Muraenolepis orangiensis TaxID=630683 RepID=A0A9Q0ILA7_9TELE|nr:hypothetical protein NHX12_030664 [Muraenolepis orangiensis]
MYDYLGHEAFLEDEKDFHDRDEHPAEEFFRFDFDDFFSSLDPDDDDGDFFMDEPHHNHWGFPMGSEDMEDMDDLHEDQQVLDSIFFDTHENHNFYGHEDEEEKEHFY